MCDISIDGKPIRKTMPSICTFLAIAKWQEAKAMRLHRETGGARAAAKSFQNLTVHCHHVYASRLTGTSFQQAQEGLFCLIQLL